jgi:SAM-dependent methyltransferase
LAVRPRALEGVELSAPGVVAQSLCRLCGSPLRHTFTDLGLSPLANSYVPASELHKPERFYPLHAWVCSECLLVQLEAMEAPEAIFTEYAYFSSFSESWLEHCRRYCQDISARLQLGAGSRVVEIASNDGYLLQYFHQAGIPVLGVEPAANVARAAQDRGIPTRVEFFGADTARRMTSEGISADLLIANNVLAHVPDAHSFVEGIRTLLKRDGVATLEFPHLLQLFRYTQFDTIYHEHYSYFSLYAVERLFAEHGLRIFDVDQLSTHGGSLRIHACHEADSRETQARVEEVRLLEERDGLHRLDTYLTFAQRVAEVKIQLWDFLVRCHRDGASVVGYGAPAKGNTLLNYCGIGSDMLPYTVDRSPHKQGLYLPGTRIPIAAPDRIAETRPDYVLILPWNLRDEIASQLASIREWGGQFVVPVPRLEVF